jgi:hypothetical protein
MPQLLVIRKTFLFLLVFVLFISCTKKQEAADNTYAYFNTNLKSSMTYADMVNKFGNPDGDLGSGIHIYYYELKDGTSIWIGYTDKIMYARHMSSSTGSAQLLHTIL